MEHLVRTKTVDLLCAPQLPGSPHALEPRRAPEGRFHTRRRRSQSRKAISRTPPPIITAIHSSGVIGFLTGTSIRFKKVSLTGKPGRTSGCNEFCELGRCEEAKVAGSFQPIYRLRFAFGNLLLSGVQTVRDG